MATSTCPSKAEEAAQPVIETTSSPASHPELDKQRISLRRRTSVTMLQLQDPKKSAYFDELESSKMSEPMLSPHKLDKTRQLTLLREKILVMQFFICIFAMSHFEINSIQERIQNKGAMQGEEQGAEQRANEEVEQATPSTHTEHGGSNEEVATVEVVKPTAPIGPLDMAASTHFGRLGASLATVVHYPYLRKYTKVQNKLVSQQPPLQVSGCVHV